MMLMLMLVRGVSKLAWMKVTRDEVIMHISSLHETMQNSDFADALSDILILSFSFAARSLVQQVEAACSKIPDHEAGGQSHAKSFS